MGMMTGQGREANTRFSGKYRAMQFAVERRAAAEAKLARDAAATEDFETKDEDLGEDLEDLEDLGTWRTWITPTTRTLEAPGCPPTQRTRPSRAAACTARARS